MPIYELSSALFCSSLISPVMMVMDTAIIRSQFKKMNIWQSYKTTWKDYKTRKISYGRPLFIMNSVYFSTYAAANLTELYCKEHHIENKHLAVFSITSLINILSITYKDRSYLQIFQNQVLRPPISSYLLFFLRDGLTIGSAFVVKKDVVEHLHQNYQWSYPMADFVSSFSIPIMAQFVSTPIHILSYDLCQHPQRNWKGRVQHLFHIYWTVCAGRIIRVIPSFCFGSYMNDMLRSNRYFLD